MNFDGWFCKNFLVTPSFNNKAFFWCLAYAIDEKIISVQFFTVGFLAFEFNDLFESGKFSYLAEEKLSYYIIIINYF